MAKPFRPYERALLQALSDGQPKHRDDLIIVTALAVPEHEAISLAQRMPSSKPFEGLSHEEQLEATQRQIVTGQRAQAGKTLSHLEKRGYIEPVGFEQRASKNVRTMFRITDYGRTTLNANLQPARRRTENPVFTTEWQEKARAMLEADPHVQAVVVHEALAEQGYEGGRGPVERWMQVNRTQPPRVAAVRQRAFPSFTDEHLKLAAEFMRENPETPQATLWRLLQEHGYTGSVTSVGDWVRKWKSEQVIARHKDAIDTISRILRTSKDEHDKLVLIEATIMPFRR